LVNEQHCYFGTSGSDKTPANFDQERHPALAHLWAANCADLQSKLVAVGATVDHTALLPLPGEAALVLSAVLPLPPHHGLPLGQIFAHNINLVDFKSALSATGLWTIPPWLDHPVFAAWLAHHRSNPIPFTSGAALAPWLPPAMFCSSTDALQEATLVFANKISHAGVEAVCPKTTRTAWKVYLGKAHPGTFKLAWPKIHALPLKDNPFLLVICPSAVGTCWAKCCSYHDWHTREVNFLPSFRPHLQSIHWTHLTCSF
jgi:hypothetical protein